MQTNNYNFLINTCTDWREPPRARHQVAHALSVNHHVVFISANRLGFPGLRTLRESENQYRTIFNNTGAATIIIAPDTTILLANDGWVNLTGIPRAAMNSFTSRMEYSR